MLKHPPRSNRNDRMRIELANSDVPYRGQAVSRAQLKINRENGVKYCYVCKETKPFECFATSKSRSDGYNPMCRDCTAQKAKERRKANPGVEAARSAAYRAANRDKVNADTRRRYHADLERSREYGRKKRSQPKYRELDRHWRKKNQERGREQARRWYQKHKEAVQASHRRYKEKNNEKILARGRAYRKENAERINAGIRERRRARLAVDDAYRLRRLAQSARWHKENRDAVHAIDHKRRARKKGAEGRYTVQDIARIRKQQKDRCAMPWCRKKLHGKGHKDHIIALARGGTNWPSNIELTCDRCNCRKHAKDPIDFAQENGMLL